MQCPASRRAISVSWHRLKSLLLGLHGQADSCCFILDIICPDNDVTEDLDKARMEWSANDVAQNRPALSRWSKEYKDEFAQFVKERTGK